MPGFGWVKSSIAKQWLAMGCFLLFSAPSWASPVADKVIVLKAAHKLRVLADNRVLYEFPLSLGRNPQGHKIQQGDSRTPEGVYRLDYKNPHSAFYKSIHISYPNALDTRAAGQLGVDPGGQIMIHGQPNGLGWLWFVSRYFDWTQGCIALSNDDMETLWNAVDAGTTVQILP